MLQLNSVQTSDSVRHEKKEFILQDDFTLRCSYNTLIYPSCSASAKRYSPNHK